MNPPPNPAADQARAAMMTYNAALKPDYFLTWPATAPGACCVTGQWRFTDSGEVEAWYTREQLEFIVEAIEKSREVER